LDWLYWVHCNAGQYIAEDAIATDADGSLIQAEFHGRTSPQLFIAQFGEMPKKKEIGRSHSTFSEMAYRSKLLPVEQGYLSKKSSNFSSRYSNPM
jgi:hypothetical protein